MGVRQKLPHVLLSEATHLANFSLRPDPSPDGSG
jgi:hypothetical protein